MGTDTDEQLDLIQPALPVNRVLLEATDSPRRAFYEVTCYHLPGAGYTVRKSSGASGAKGNTETWWRPNLRQAVEKQALLINAKLKPSKKGRIYTLTIREGIQL